MAGVVPGDAVMTDRPQGRGLVVLEASGRAPWLPSGTPPIHAHEFHYARLVNVEPSAAYAFNVRRGAGIDGRRDGIVMGNTVAGFAHLRDTSRCRWAESFVAFVRQTRLGAGVPPPCKQSTRPAFPERTSAGRPASSGCGNRGAAATIGRTAAAKATSSRRKTRIASPCRPKGLSGNK
jgi:hypothetical protein